VERFEFHERVHLHMRCDCGADCVNFASCKLHVDKYHDATLSAELLTYTLPRLPGTDDNTELSTILANYCDLRVSVGSIGSIVSFGRGVDAHAAGDTGQLARGVEGSQTIVSMVLK